MRSGRGRFATGSNVKCIDTTPLRPPPERDLERGRDLRDGADLARLLQYRVRLFQRSRAQQLLIRDIITGI